jgi:hypothetical protein
LTAPAAGGIIGGRRRLMNRIEREHFGLLGMTHEIRDLMLATLTPEDLVFHPPGDNPPLRELCVEQGRCEHLYARSFATLKIDFREPLPEGKGLRPGEPLIDWFHRLDADLDGALRSISDDDIEKKAVDRGGWTAPLSMQFHIYREGLLIFFGKVDVYLRALGKARPEKWKGWVG